MKVDKNRIIPGQHGKDILLDVYYTEGGSKKPVIVFAHGFKGFKDWGHFSAMANYFASKGFVFIKFNFSHNGTTPEKPTEFADLEAFGQNNYTKELDDLKTVLDNLENGTLLPTNEIDFEKVNLLGHSRGGAMVIIKAWEDGRISKVATLGAVSYVGTRFNDKEVEEWRKKGVVYFPNARTGQQMPMYWQILEDYETQQERFNVEKKAASLNVPLMVVHGTSDETIPYEEAQALVNGNKNAKLVTIEGGNHTFGGMHPFIRERLPRHTQQAVEAIVAFYRE